MTPPLSPLPAWNYSNTTRWCHRIGVFSLLLYMFAWVLSLDVSRSFEPLLMLVYLIALGSQPGRRYAFADPLWILLGLWLAAQLITLPAAIAMFPDWAEGQVNSMRGLTKVFMILPIAWVMAGSVRIALWTLSALLLGMVMGSLLTGETPTTLAHYIVDGRRPTLGFQNWQHAGVCAGVMLLAQACFAHRFLRASGQHKGWQKWLLRGVFALVALWALTAWMITMTRAAWLGMAVVVALALAGLLVALASGRLRDPALRRRLLWALLPSLVAVILVALVYGSQIADRLFAEQHVMAEVLSGNLANVPFSSIGFRIHAWHYALQLFAEHPWFGWGPKSHIPLLLQSTSPIENTTLGAIAQQYGLRHFHSSYVTLLVANGLAGVMIYLGVIAVIGRAAWQSWRRGDMPGDMMIFLALFFVFWAVVNGFESYIDYRTGVYVIGAIGGMAYTFSMRRRLTEQAGHAGYCH
ncbi:O-antigen ligase family protein [Kushneria aurantia]|uniref:O-antigen ligase family protein n=1 Tax=Kushneria aurantia TaxID=504092 RepID=A0ABV6FZ23_9GAMM|nr:O-antigen ligase family protein [Kushneria aurantia]